MISPAEKWQAFLDLSKRPGLNAEIKRVAVATTEWELTAQHSGTANGNDIQTWKYGVSDKFYVERHDVRGPDGAGCFRIQNKSFRESGNGRYWDIEGRNLKPGGNVHVWDFKNGALSQWFYLEEDGDGDPETFFLKKQKFRSLHRAEALLQGSQKGLRAWKSIVVGGGLQSGAERILLPLADPGAEPGRGKRHGQNG